MLTRIRCLRKLADKLGTIKKIFASKKDKDMEHWVNTWIDLIHESLAFETEGTRRKQGQYELNSYRQPLGVIVIATSHKYKFYPMTAIISALMQGNSVVILLMGTCVFSQFYLELCKVIGSCGFPPGVFNVIFNSTGDVFSTAVKHKRIGAFLTNKYFDVFADVKFADAQKMKMLVEPPNSIEDSIRYVTYVKNVWCNVGESFI